MSRRFLKIKNFKNIGITKGEDEYQTLYLNNSLYKDKIGELIILIGENNVGKSNVLDALCKICKLVNSSVEIGIEDIPEFSEYENYMPEIKMVYDIKSKEYISTDNINLDKLKMEFEEKLQSYSEYAKDYENVANGLKRIRNRYNEIIKDEKNINNYSVELKRMYNKMETIINNNLVNSHNNKNKDNKLKKLNFDWNKLLNSNNKDIKELEYKCYFDKKSNSVKFSTNNNIDNNTIKQEFEDKFNVYANQIDTNSFSTYKNKLNKIKNELENIYNTYNENITENKEAFNKLKKLYNDLRNLLTNFTNNYNILNYSTKLQELKFIDFESISLDTETIIEKDYGIDFIPKAVFYVEENIENKDLVVNTNNFSKSKFFKSLLKSIKKENYIDKISSDNYMNKRRDYENEINKELDKMISKKFNELYFNNSKTQEYKFEIRLEHNLIQLFLQKNKNTINLNNQSVGFKWFFNFFFNFLYANELKAGDIVLMDEPEIHLSIPGRRDLRKFIKKFARDTGITFICATHNPSFINIDYLEELRIIKQKSNGLGVEIQNDFSALGGSEVDALDEIINSFGILHKDIITNPNNKVIFVEGITDYNYLTAFKLLYNKDEKRKLNLVFLPIGGLGSNNDEMKNKLLQLTKFRDAVMLIDSDNRANEFKELSKSEEVRNKLTIIQLKEADDSFKEIEDLFSQKDRKYIYKSMIDKKSGCQSALFKNTILSNELEKETIDNFNKVLVFLNNMS